MFNAELFNVVAVDSAVTNRGGGDTCKNLYGLAAYFGASKTWMGMGRCSAKNKGEWNVRQWEEYGYDLRGPEHYTKMVLDERVPEYDALQGFIEFVGDATVKLSECSHRQQQCVTPMVMVAATVTFDSP